MSWQNLIREWLRRTAEARLREAMAAAQESPGERAAAPGAQVARPDRAAHVGVVMAEHREAVGVIDRLDGLLTTEADRVQVYEGGLHKRRLAVVVCGTSPQGIADATEALIDGHRPQWLMAGGFCTGLDPALSVSDLVLARQVVSSESVLPAMAPQDGAWQTGRLLSLSQLNSDPVERQHLAKQHEAIAADSHAYWVVEAARRREIPCAALAVVRRAVNDQSPRDIDRLRRKQSLSRRIGLLAGIVLNRPGNLKKVWSEKEGDLVAGDRLADGIGTLIDRLKEGT
jgi:nucleoside phosphorylase